MPKDLCEERGREDCCPIDEGVQVMPRGALD